MDRAFLLGLGLDCKDDQKRITLAENYKLYGGSKQTHELMREKCRKFNEQLKKKHKSLDEIESNEFYDIAHKVGLKIPKEPKKRRF